MTDTPRDVDRESQRQAALDYHRYPKPGKLEVRATKPLANGGDLSRAYSPGVAEACYSNFNNATCTIRCRRNSRFSLVYATLI